MLMSSIELADRAGLSASTLAEYLRRGLIQPVAMAPEARYGEDAWLRLQVIAKGKRLGFTLDEIKKLIESRSSLSPSSQGGQKQQQPETMRQLTE